MVYLVWCLDLDTHLTELVEIFQNKQSASDFVRKKNEEVQTDTSLTKWEKSVTTYYFERKEVKK